MSTCFYAISLLVQTVQLLNLHGIWRSSSDALLHVIHYLWAHELSFSFKFKKCLKFSNTSVNEKASVTTDLQNVLTSFCHGSLIITEKPICRKYTSFTLLVVHFIQCQPLERSVSSNLNVDEYTRLHTRTRNGYLSWD